MIMKKNNAKYWLDRLIKQEDLIYKSNSKDILDEVSRIYLSSQKDILKELLSLQAYNRSNNITALSREIMLEETLQNINKTIVLLANNMNNLLTKNLTNSYIQTYETVNDTLKGLGFTPKEILPANIEDIIKQPWTGQSFSDRIWYSRDKLIFEAKDTISRGLIREESYHNMATELSKKMNASYSNSRRLIETEVQVAQVKANIDNYKNNDIEKVQISAVLDSKCCMDCMDHDGKIIDSDKIQVYEVVRHPNCRCTTLPCIYIDGKLVE